MKTIKLNHYLPVMFMLPIFFFQSCRKDKPQTNTNNNTGGYTNGVFIVNEGPFMTGTGTISFYSRSTGMISNDIFQTKNGYPIGNIAQSMTIHNGNGYIVVNNAGKIETVNANTFQANGPITGLTMPRYFLGIDNNIGYVSEWGTGGVQGAVKVIDLNTKTIIQTITTGKGAEQMVKVGDYVYVACGGGFDTDSVVTVINTNNHTVVTSIVVGANPYYIKTDMNNNIWVLCKGKWNITWTALEETGKLVKINTTNNSLDLSLTFSSLYSQPSNLCINNNKNTLYYLYDGKVYSQQITSSSLNTNAIINRSYYSLDIDPTNNYILCTDAVDFANNGKFIRHNPLGIVVDSFVVGIIPTGFSFN